jgi:hypothetical protein
VGSNAGAPTWGERCETVPGSLGTSHARGVFWIPAYTTTRSNAPNLIAVPIPIKTMPISPKCTCDAFSVVIQQLQLTCSFKVDMPIHVSQALGKGREKLQ